MLSFVWDFQKLKSHQIESRQRHNEGKNSGSYAEEKSRSWSQKDSRLWFTREGKKTCIPWNQARLDDARKLSKRKDAVEAFSLVLQCGNQDDWRNELGEQLPQSEWPASLEKMEAATIEWATTAFGKENIVSLSLHLDESSPHFHLLVTPIHANKLQSKHWLCQGIVSLRKLREDACKTFVKHGVDCGYEVGREGGKPHDDSKSTGGSGKGSALADAIARIKHLEKDEQDSIKALAEQEIQIQKLLYKEGRLLEDNKALQAAWEKKAIEVVTMYKNKISELENKVISLENANKELTNQVTELSAKEQKNFVYEGETISREQMMELFIILQKGHPTDGNCVGDDIKSVAQWESALISISNLTTECKAEFEDRFMWKIRNSVGDIYTSDDSKLAISEALNSKPQQTNQQSRQNIRATGAESTRDASVNFER